MDSHPKRHRSPLIVGLGEALFDCFADHVQIGGAPVNLAIHANSLLKKCSGRAVVASSVGDDVLGHQFLSTLKDLHMDSRVVKIDPVHPTSRVNVNVDRHGQPSYQFEANVAWDHLDFTPSWQILAGDCNAVCYGTLAQRSAKSRETILKFLRHAPNAIRLFDVNLRANYYTSDIVRESLELASAAKLNTDELPEVCRLLDLDGPENGRTDQVVQLLMEIFRLDWMALTRGALGTVLYVDGNRYEAGIPVYSRHANADAVGAGDACGAALLVAALLRWPCQRWVTLANDVGAFVASRPGAIPSLPEQMLEEVVPVDDDYVADPLLSSNLPN